MSKLWDKFLHFDCIKILPGIFEPVSLHLHGLNDTVYHLLPIFGTRHPDDVTYINRFDPLSEILIQTTLRDLLCDNYFSYSLRDCSSVVLETLRITNHYQKTFHPLGQRLDPRDYHLPLLS